MGLVEAPFVLDEAVDVASLTPSRRDWALRRLLVAGDLVGVVLALIAALALAGRMRTGDRILWGLFGLPVMVVLFKLYGLYDRDVKRISHSTVDDIPWLLHATVIGTLVVWGFARLSPMGRMDLAEVLLFGTGCLVFTATARFGVRQIATRVIGPERAVLVGDWHMARALVTKLAAHPEYRLAMIGALIGVPSGGPEVSVCPLPVLGNIDQLDDIATLYGINRIVLAADYVDELELGTLLRRCRGLSLKVSLLPRLSDLLGAAVEIDDVEGVTVLGVNPPWLPRSSRAIKRAVDIGLAALLLGLIAPLLLLIAIAIKLDSRGPVLFSQERVGRSGRPFRLLKLRTMVADAEHRRSHLLDQSTDPNWLKLDCDPRITRIGRWLRRLSLDELPQLWNVLRGEMSMVGPRPLIPAEDKHVKGWARGRLDLTPGITGYWQVLGRTRIPFEEMVKLDYLYVMNWSLWEDIRLMLRTLPAVVAGRGVN